VKAEKISNTLLLAGDSGVSTDENGFTDRDEDDQAKAESEVADDGHQIGFGEDAGEIDSDQDNIDAFTAVRLALRNT
jgi:hypothetical protein